VKAGRYERCRQKDEDEYALVPVSEIGKGKESGSLETTARTAAKMCTLTLRNESVLKAVLLGKAFHQPPSLTKDQRFRKKGQSFTNYFASVPRGFPGRRRWAGYWNFQPFPAGLDRAFTGTQD
jgi:hypothetical protein